MKLQHHVAASVTISGILYLIFKSWSLSLACFLSGVIIDVDHFIDYFRENRLSLDMKDFFRTCNEYQFERIVLILHGWEWIVIIAIAAWFTNWNPWLTGTIAGITQHLMLDTLFNSSDFRTYSFLWRFRHKFHFDTVFSNLKEEKYRLRK